MKRYGIKWKRYGIKWNGPEQPIATEMEDGYWTPWHEAQAEVDRLLEAITEAAEDMRDGSETSAWAILVTALNHKQPG